jgi:hypothetical protein
LSDIFMSCNCGYAIQTQWTHIYLTMWDHFLARKIC